MAANSHLSSAEIGTLWMTYQEKTLILRMLDYFIEKADDRESKQIMVHLQKDIEPYVEKMKKIFEKHGLEVPVGFTEDDVTKEVPKLYDNGFDIMFVRLVNEIGMGMHTLNLTMSYQKEIIEIYRELTYLTQKYYEKCTQYLIEKGLLPQAPYVSIQKPVEHVQDKDYLKMFKPIKGRRALNTVEMTHIHHAIESNVIGMQMIYGFSQVAKEPEARAYFHEGGELAKKIVKKLTTIMFENDTPAPMTPGGNVTQSHLSPFSDKMMLYCVSLFCSFSLGGNSLGTAFSLRNDLPAKLSLFMKDIFEYAHKGAKMMIKHGWMEEPPQTEKH
ncbi:DUF3231 family protein [Halobacillus halophilus]|uniref:DUF3231 family protein n=1 Tax=Halobacillus halophilus TaxID=1570 RepID=UPI0013692B60|nr:DUF3231 family protein [Halobacillus halophilus]MYL30106.1 DUF3231 family protein [Halobacillus halophilus]